LRNVRFEETSTFEEGETNIANTVEEFRPSNLDSVNSNIQLELLRFSEGDQALI
jgi:hypothetical protein